MFGRKVKTLFDALRPRKTRETSEENQSGKFNGKCRTGRIFSRGDSVLVKDYPANRSSSGVILRRRGNVVYEVDVGGTVWIRHANQIRHCMRPDIIQERKMNLPLDILLETFEMQSKNESTGLNIGVNPSPFQRTRRQRISVKRLQINPRLRTYDMSPEEGSVRTHPDMKKHTCRE
ncbi:hypothetical protein CLF_105901 [Clonorchis sinensis]|uniref:Uncharacterized protein n=1 Tax=Clonorchis sinensis TaxID=79923 RepID=G7YPJ2_CLOSI|nr:hypothetical protein CLF_105901 [Clonorchis sinensis]